MRPLLGIVLFVAVSGCGSCSEHVARSADMFANDLPVFVEHSRPAEGVDEGSWQRLASALVDHARALARAARGGE